MTSSPRRSARSVTVVSRRRELERVLEHVDERPLQLRRIGRIGGRSVGHLDPDPFAVRSSSSACSTSASAVQIACAGAAAAAWRRDRSSMFSTYRLSRWSSSRTESSSSARWLRRAGSSGSAKPSSAASIVASGVRRSCDTDWITDVLTASVRRNVSASSASRSRRSRSFAIATSDATACSSRTAAGSVDLLDPFDQLAQVAALQADARRDRRAGPRRARAARPPPLAAASSRRARSSPPRSRDTRAGPSSCSHPPGRTCAPAAGRTS